MTDPTDPAGHAHVVDMHALHEATEAAKAAGVTDIQAVMENTTMTDPTAPGDWTIQEVPQEGAPFLLYRGVLVGRLYGGCPYELMLELLNPTEPKDADPHAG